MNQLSNKIYVSEKGYTSKENHLIFQIIKILHGLSQIILGLFYKCVQRKYEYYVK